MSAANVRKSRRNFLKAVPVAVAGAVASKSWAQGQGSQNAGPVTADTVKAAEVLDGVQFTPDEETAAARGANANLNNYNRIRQLNIPQDTEPAYVFKPSLPGKEPKGPATPGAVIKYTKPPLTLKRPANLEDVAFWPVTRLAALVERKLVTSTELTNMYLSRLKKYQPILNFYVTLTEELALKQAADADRAIAAGKYKGPLHGIPWGAKDLFATKGIKTTWGGEPYVNQIIDYDATIVERLRDAGAVLVAKLAARFAPYGIEARHLKVFKHAADRQTGLFSQVVTPLLRQRNPEARARAIGELAELAELGEALMGCFTQATLRELTGG